MIELTKSDLDMLRRGIMPPYLSRFSTQELLQTFAETIIELNKCVEETLRYVNDIDDSLDDISDLCSLRTLRDLKDKATFAKSTLEEMEVNQ